MEAWWDSSYDCRAVVSGYRVSRKDRPGCWEGEFPFMWESSRDAWSSAWWCMKIRMRAYRSGLAGRPVWVMSWLAPPTNWTGVDEPFFNNWKNPPIQNPWYSWGILMIICWKQPGHKQPRRSVEGIADNILTQVIKELMKGDVLLDLTLANRETLQGKLKAGSSFGCTQHEEVKFRIIRGNIMAKSIKTWASEEQTLAYSGTCLEESHGIQPWREKRSRKVVGFSSITSSWCVQNQAEEAGGLCGWAYWSWQNSNITRGYTGGIGDAAGI